MKKEFEKYGVLNEISRSRFYGRISEGWDFYDEASDANGEKYDIVYSSSKMIFGWLEKEN